MFRAFFDGSGPILATRDGMLGELKKSWRVFKRAAPGERFQTLYRERKGHGTSRIAFALVGILLIAGGIVLLFIPGPGIPLIAFGVALLAQQSLWLAKLMDRLEPVLRRLARKGESLWKKAATPLKAALVSGAALVVAAAIYGAYLVFLKD
jgi:putative transmembrane protein PGPGW